MKVYMFHYVQKNFSYFHFDFNMFEKFIKEYSKKYNFIGLEDFKSLYNNNNVFKEKDNNVLLTFDDGTKDHYKYVYKILKKYNAKGLFFLTSNIFERKILDIHKIHMLISKVDCNLLSNDILVLAEQESLNIDREKMVKTKYDNDEMKFVKQMLQYILPDEIRKKILDTLLNKYNIKISFDDFYLSINEIMEMRDNGMEFGIHTKSNKRLEFLSKDEQKKEIEENIKKLEKNGVLSNIRTIAYPFGSYNKETFDILKKNRIEFAFTIDAKYNKKSKYEIERIDAKKLEKIFGGN